MKKTKYLIIGAGITGISFANFINTENYTIIEKEDYTGGYCNTINKQNYYWDYSGHFFHFKDEKIKQLVTKNIQKEEILEVTKNTKIFYKNKLIDFPFQKNIHQLEKKEFIECLHDLYFKPTKTPHNFKEMLLSKFGKGISEKFLFPYNEKLYSCDLNTLDVDAMGRFFPHANFDEIMKNMKTKKDKSYNSSFIYFKKGIKTVINSLLKNIETNNIRFSEKIEKIDTAKKIAETNKEKYKYEYLISTIPFIELLKNTGKEYNSEEFPYNKVFVINIGLDQEVDLKEHWIYFPEKKYCFYRVGFYNNIKNEKKGSLYIEIGFDSNEKINEKYWYEKAIEDLKKTRIITTQKIIAKHTITLNPAYVHITTKSNDKVSKLKKELSKSNVFSIGRYGSWTYCSMEDNIIEAKKTAKQITQNET